MSLVFLSFQFAECNLAIAGTVFANDPSFGYDPNDATAALQAAIDHGIATGDTVVVPSGTPWPISAEINVANPGTNLLNLVFQPGVLVEAKAGAFMGTGDKLFQIKDSSNIAFSGSGGATLKMRKADYQMPPYTPSEFRHAINIQGSSNVTIQGLTIQESGGDGIYVGPSSTTSIHSSDIVLRDLVVDDNHRNGLSIVSVKNLLVENSMFSNTSGTAPEAGIDIEPNVFGDVLQNIVLRNNVINSNTQRGLFFSTGAFDSRSEFFDVLVEDTTISGGIYGIAFAENGFLGSTGSVTVREGSITGTTREGIYIQNRAGGDLVDVDILDYQLTNVATDGGVRRPINFEWGLAGGPTGGVDFTNINVVDSINREFLFATATAQSAGVANVQGDFFIDNPHGATWDLGPNLTNVNIQVSTDPPSTQFTWNQPGFGSWHGGSANWVRPSGWGIVPNGSDHTAIFGGAITSSSTVVLDAPATVNRIQFDNASHAYVIAGTSVLTLEPDGANESTIEVASGNHKFQVEVHLSSDTDVTVVSGSLDFNNLIDLNGNTLTTSGNVNINHPTTGGGAIASTGSLGTAGVALIGGDLISTGLLEIDLGAAHNDTFNVAGAATLSGTLDVVLEPGFSPDGSYTVLTAGGSLDASSLLLDASDTSTFSMAVVGNHLVLTTIPEPGTGMLMGIALFLSYVAAASSRRKVE